MNLLVQEILILNREKFVLLQNSDIDGLYCCLLTAKSIRAYYDKDHQPADNASRYVHLVRTLELYAGKGQEHELIED